MFSSVFCTYVRIWALICSYNHYLKNLLLFATALFSPVCQKPLIQELCFSSCLTVIALWKLGQQNTISNNVASVLVGQRSCHLQGHKSSDCTYRAKFDVCVRGTSHDNIKGFGSLLCNFQGTSWTSWCCSLSSVTSALLWLQPRVTLLSKFLDASTQAHSVYVCLVFADLCFYISYFKGGGNILLCTL